MNFNDLKKTGVNNIIVDDSLSAPILDLKISCCSNVLSSDNSQLIIYVDKSEEVSNERKQFVFNLNSDLQFYDNISDEFYLTTEIVDGKLLPKCYVKRRIGNDALLIEEILEEINYEPIVLFEGENYISTNYENINLELIYPKDCDLLNLFYNNVLAALTNKNHVFSLDDIYFKDCFTEVEAGINALFNKTTTKCFDSPTNAFSMDCEGNLVVNTISVRNGNDNNISFDLIYPVGSVYLSVNDINPSNLFGGVWEQINGYYLFAGNNVGTGGSSVSGEANGNTGSTVLNVNNLPVHSHSIPALSGTAKSAGGHSHKLGMVSGSVSSGSSYARPKDVSEVTTRGYTSTTAGAHTHNVSTTASTSGNAGGGVGHTHSLNEHTHDITPPFYSVFVFKRVA